MEDANTDSAFTIFLKLIFASPEQMRPTLREDEYLGRTKKLLSLVTPVGSVQLSALRSPFDKQLLMLYNRFSCRECPLPRLTCPVLRRLWPIRSGHAFSVHPRRQLSRVAGA